MYLQYIIPGHYLRIPSSRLLEGDRAYIILQNVSHAHPTSQAVSFKMFGSDIGSVGGLSISATKMTAAPVTLFATSIASFLMIPGSTGQWRDESFCMLPGFHDLIITGVQGHEYASDLAIDNIQLTDRECFVSDDFTIGWCTT